MASANTPSMTMTTTARSDDGYLEVYCPECDANSEASPDELDVVCSNCGIDTMLVPLPPQVREELQQLSGLAAG